MLLSKVWQAKRKCFFTFPHTFCPFCFLHFKEGKKPTKPQNQWHDRFLSFCFKKEKERGWVSDNGLEEVRCWSGSNTSFVPLLAVCIFPSGCNGRAFCVTLPHTSAPTMSCTDSGSRFPTWIPCYPSQMAVGRCNCRFIWPLRYDAEVKSWMEEPRERKAFPSLWERMKQHRVQWRCECHVGLSSTLALALIWDFIYI